MKSRKDILLDFMNMVGQYNRCFFKLTDGEDCFGEIEVIDNDFLQFSPDWDEALKDRDYQRHYDYECDQDASLQFILIPLQDVDIYCLYYWDQKAACFINIQWSFDEESWAHKETKPGSIPLSKYLLQHPKDNKSLKAVGYWQSDESQPYEPHPKYLVEPRWRESERSMIVAYLKSGHECGHWCGYSYCRFDCFSEPPEENASELVRRKFFDGMCGMGCRDLTDGEWVWPEGLAHYVEEHDVCLPNEFIEAMQKNSWLVPAKVDFQHRSEVGVSYFYWIHWAIEHVREKHKSFDSHTSISLTSPRQMDTQD